MPQYNVSRIGSATDGYAIDISVAVSPDGSDAATATRNQGGDLQLTSWNLLPGGNIQQSTQLIFDPQAIARIAPVGTGMFVTIGESTQGPHLKAVFWWRSANITWEGKGSEGYSPSVVGFPTKFELIGPPPPPPPPGTQVAYPTGYLIATAHVTPNHHIRVTAWFAAVENTYGIGPLAAASGTESIFACIAVKSSDHTTNSLNSADVVTGNLNSEGRLHLGTWRLHVEPMQQQSVEHVYGVATHVIAKEVAIATYPPDPATTLVTAVINSAGNLEILDWTMNSDGTFTRGLETTGEPASLVSCAWCAESIVVTAFKDSAGKLKLIYWQFPASSSDPQVITAIAQLEENITLPYGGISVAHWRVQGAMSNDLGETVVAVLTAQGNARVLRYHLTSS